MYETIIIIPARLGSTRLPRKLLLNLHGKPVLARTIAQAKKTTKIDQIFVATDSLEIAKVSEVLIDKNTLYQADENDAVPAKKTAKKSAKKPANKKLPAKKAAVKKKSATKKPASKKAAVKK